ncbi:probable aquaporin NIP7-1 [Camellia sinensis]|uniref:probable aquaporin NIP7-1 n=1 Tax=Camellia sinensis TaxID=4442 RepID=UPI001035C61B|nr:probable aquaporin NIP7-1 [Camellia sinensis]
MVEVRESSCWGYLGGVYKCFSGEVLAEAMGTFIMMFCICAIIAITQLMGGQVGLLEYAATAALTVVVVIFSIGAISGAHVNPSITFAFATLGQFPWSQVLAEAMGTFIMMFCICAIIAITQLMGGQVGLLEYAATAALTVVVVIFSIGAISGAHVNPSITFAFATLGQFPRSQVLVLAEAMGTFILMFCICAIIAITQLMGGQVGLLEYAATSALTVVVVIFSIGAISGAHVNPSITFAFATLGQFPWSQVPLYIIAQIMGSTLATYVGSLVYGIKSELMITRPLQGSTTAFWVELIATFIIMFLASSLEYQSKYVGHLSGFIVGTAIGLAVLISGPISGGSMNPARSLGPAIVSWKFGDVWIYLIAPTVGAVGGALLFRALRLQHHPCGPDSSPNTTRLRQPLH